MISTAGHGTPGTDLFKDLLPSKPDAAAVVLDYESLPPARAMASSPGAALAEIHRVQLVVRDKRYDGAMKRARDIWFSLDGAGRAVNGVQYRSIFALQSPFSLGEDAGGRAVVVCNYEVVRDPATSS